MLSVVEGTMSGAGSFSSAGKTLQCFAYSSRFLVAS